MRFKTSIALIFFLVGTYFFLAPTISQTIDHQIREQIGVNTPYTIEYDLEKASLFQLSVKNVHLKENGSPTFSADHLHLKIAPLSTIWRQITLPLVEIEGLKLHPKKNAEPLSKTSLQKTFKDILKPGLQWDVLIKKVHVRTHDNLVLKGNGIALSNSLHLNLNVSQAENEVSLKVRSSPGGLKMRCKGVISTPPLSFSTDLRMKEDLAFIFSGETSSSYGNAELSFNARPDWNLESGLLAANFEQGELNAELSGDLLSPQVRASATVKETDLTGDVQLVIHPEEIALKSLALRSAKTVLQGDLAFRLQTQELMGNLYLNSDDLAPLSPLAGGRLDGSCQISAKFSNDPWTINGKGKHLRFNGIRTQSLQFQSRGNTFSVAARELTHEDLMLERIKVFGSTEELTIEAAGRRGEAFKLVTRVSRDEEGFRVKAFEGVIATHKVMLHEQVLIETQDRLNISPTHLTIGKGSLEAVFGVSGNAVILNQVPLEVLNLYLTEFPVGGQIWGEVRAEGSLEEPLGNAELKINNFAIHGKGRRQLETPPIINLACNGEIRGKDFNFLAATTEGSLVNGKAALSGELKGKAQAILELEGPIAPFVQFAFTDAKITDGFVKGELSLSGSTDQLEAEGVLELSHGAYENLETGLVLREVHGTFYADGDRLLVDDLTARSGEKGFIKGKAELSLNPSKHFPYEVGVKLHGVPVINMNFARAAGKGILNLKGDFQSAKASGNVEVMRADLGIPDDRPKASELEVTYINQPEYESSPANLKERRRLPLELDIDVSIPKNAYVDGRGLSSEWQGMIHVSGSNQKPLLDGEVEIRKGEFFLSGRPFTIEKGKILFQGAPNRAYLDVVARTDAGPLTVRAELRGPVADPDLRLTSMPPMDQNEILSWVLFNESINRLTPSQGVQLAQVAIQLSGNQAGGDVMQKLRKSLGLDRLDIGLSGIQAGKYLSKGVLISFNKSITPDDNLFIIELELLKHFKIQADFSDEDEDRVLFKWQKRY